MPVRVLIADDQAMVRTGFRLILAGQPDLEVVGEAVNGEEAVRLVRELRPDVALMDIRMPLVDGLEATRLLAGRTETTRIVVVTTYDDDENVDAALRAGASGFLLKDAGPELLIEAVRAAARGDALLSPAVTPRLMRQFARGEAARTADGQDQLTPRELDVVRAVARGRTNAEAADELAISVSTVKAHLNEVRRKLGLRNRTEIAVWAWEARLVD